MFENIRTKSKIPTQVLENGEVKKKRVGNVPKPNMERIALRLDKTLIAQIKERTRKEGFGNRISIISTKAFKAYLED